MQCLTRRNQKYCRIDNQLTLHIHDSAIHLQTLFKAIVFHNTTIHPFKLSIQKRKQSHKIVALHLAFNAILTLVVQTSCFISTPEAQLSGFFFFFFKVYRKSTQSFAICPFCFCVLPLSFLVNLTIHVLFRSHSHSTSTITYYYNTQHDLFKTPRLATNLIYIYSLAHAVPSLIPRHFKSR